jgi:hypothetical protein
MIAVKRFHNRNYSSNQRRKEPRRARPLQTSEFSDKNRFVIIQEL